jgi:hypothetical protein
MSEQGLLLTIQAILADFVEGDPYFSDIPIITENAKDIVGEMDKALGPIAGKAGKSGICVIMNTPVSRLNDPNTHPTYFDDIPVIGVVRENVTINQGSSGTGKHALAVAEVLLAVMQQYRGSERALCFWPDKVPIVPVMDEEYRTYNAVVHTQGGYVYSVTTVATPVITAIDGNTFKVTCATAGASAYYTVDGTRPTQASTAVDLDNNVDLAGPLPVTVRVRAYKDGLRSSIIASRLFED